MSSSIVRRDTVIPARGSGRAERVRAGGEGVQEFLVFVLGEERMGLPLASVKELLKLHPITEVPRAADDVLGILSVRGRITTILDLRRRLHMETVRPTRHTRILLVDGGHEVMGLVVDAVLHVVRLREDEIEGPGVVASDVPEHVLGLGRPRRGKDSVRGLAGSRAASAEAREPSASEAEVIVLLDPVALLRR
jgi:purine-binding chemotaxis protein CheW